MKHAILAVGLSLMLANTAAAADVCRVLWSGADDAQVIAITETIALTEGNAVVGETFTTEAVGKVMLQIVGGCDNVAALPSSNRTPVGFAAFALRMAGIAAPGEYPETVSVEDFSAQLRGNGFPLTWGGVVVRKPVTQAEAAAALDTLRNDIEAYKRSVEANQLAFSEGQAALEARVAELERLGQNVNEEKSSLDEQAQALADLRSTIAIWRQADEVEAAAQNKAIAENGTAIGTVRSDQESLRGSLDGKLDKSELQTALQGYGLIDTAGRRVSDTVNVDEAVDSRLVALGLTIENGKIVLPAPPAYDLDKALVERGVTLKDGKVVFPQGMTIDGLKALGFTFEGGQVVFPEAGVSGWLQSLIGLALALSLLTLGTVWWLRRNVTTDIDAVNQRVNGINQDVTDVLVTLNGDGSDENPGLVATVATQGEQLDVVKAAIDNVNETATTALAAATQAVDDTVASTGNGVRFIKTTHLPSLNLGDSSTWELEVDGRPAALVFTRKGDGYHTNLPRNADGTGVSNPVTNVDADHVKALVRKAHRVDDNGRHRLQYIVKGPKVA